MVDDVSILYECCRLNNSYFDKSARMLGTSINMSLLQWVGFSLYYSVSPTLMTRGNKAKYACLAALQNYTSRQRERACVTGAIHAHGMVKFVPA